MHRATDELTTSGAADRARPPGERSLGGELLPRGVVPLLQLGSAGTSGISPGPDCTGRAVRRQVAAGQQAHLPDSFGPGHEVAARFGLRFKLPDYLIPLLSALKDKVAA